MEADADILLYNTEWGEMDIKEELNQTIAKRQSVVDGTEHTVAFV